MKQIRRRNIDKSAPPQPPPVHSAEEGRTRGLRPEAPIRFRGAQPRQPSPIPAGGGARIQFMANTAPSAPPRRRRSNYYTIKSNTSSPCLNSAYVADDVAKDEFRLRFLQTYVSRVMAVCAETNRFCNRCGIAPINMLV